MNALSGGNFAPNWFTYRLQPLFVPSLMFSAIPSEFFVLFNFLSLFVPTPDLIWIIFFFSFAIIQDSLDLF